MNAREAFPGTGMTRTESDTASINAAYEMERVMASERAGDDDAFADAVSEVLEQQKEPVTDRGIFERSLANRRAEKLRQQEIARAALAKAKQLTASIHAMEAALDGLLVFEA